LVLLGLPVWSFCVDSVGSICVSCLDLILGVNKNKVENFKSL